MTVAGIQAPRDPTARLSDVISTYRPTKLFKATKPETYVTSLDFDYQGELLVAACDDETLQLYNCRDGCHNKTLFSKKYGAHLARFTHQSSSVLYASTKVDDTIRFLSTHDNQYIRYFPGHLAAVTCIAVAPGGDEFISCSLDNTLRIWNINTPNVAGKLTLHTPYLAAYDPSATVIAVASPGTSSVLLFDVRNYDKAPFATFDLAHAEQTYQPKTFGPSYRPNGIGNPGRWTSLEFSNDGSTLLLGTASGAGHYLVDAFTGAVTGFCAPHDKPGNASSSEHAANNNRPNKASTRLAPGARPSSTTSSSGSAVPAHGSVCFTPDARYVIGGAGDQNMYVWDTHQARARSGDSHSSSSPSGSGEHESSSGGSGGSKNGVSANLVLKPLHELEFRGPAAVVAFDHRFNLCVSADQDVVFWVPDQVAGGDAPEEGDGSGDAGGGGDGGVGAA